MKEIILSQGLKALIDDDDFERVSPYKWHANETEKGSGRYYARCDRVKDGKIVRQLLHRFIMDAPLGLKVDHIDRNPLNNCKSNLRLATQSQNMCNMARKNKTSQYKGVCWESPRPGGWIAYVSINHKSIRIGRFETELEAARAYNEIAPKYQGEFAVLNKLLE